MRWLVLLGLVALPIQWVLVPLPVLGAQRLSIAAALIVSGVAVLRCPRSVFRSFLALTWPFAVGMGALTLVWMATDVLHATDTRVAFNHGVQLGIFVCFGTAVALCCRSPRALSVLRWAGLVCNVVLLAALSSSMLANGVDPLETIGTTVTTGDPAVLQTELFRNGLVGFGFAPEDLLSNVRHEIVAGVLVAALLAEVAVRMRPFRSRAAHALTHVSLVLSVVIIVLSLSRSVTIALLVWPLLALWRAWQRQRLAAGQVAAGVVAVIAVAVSVAVGFASLVVSKFADDTTSYDKRGGLIEDALRNLVDRPFLGGVDTAGASSHNFLLDSWLRSGLVGALLALAVTTVLVLLWCSIVLRLHEEPSWMVPVAVCLALALIRLFTAGGGALPPVEWVAMAVVGGVMTHRAHLGGASTTATEATAGARQTAG